MRIRFKPWAREELETSPFYIDNPQMFKNRWKTAFENDYPIYLELGCGKGNFIAKMASMNKEKHINYIAIDLVDSMLGIAKRNVEKEYPVLVTTSKLLSTGVDVQTVKFIVLDSNIRSMTEFKQIIGRGTRVREDLGKMYFTIFDFRDVTRLFHDPDFDGPIEQQDDFHPNKPEEEPEMPPKITPPERERRQKYILGDTPVTVSQKHVQYLDQNGHLITERLVDYTKRSVLSQYAEMDDFLNA